MVLPSVAAPQVPLAAVLAGTARFAGPADAALYNGAIAHALDWITTTRITRPMPISARCWCRRDRPRPD
jgi:hypothetical protein